MYLICPLNPKLHMGCDTVLHQNPLRQKSRKKKLSTWSKCGPKGRICPNRKLINQMHESRSPTKCEFPLLQAEISNDSKDSSLKH